MPIIIIQPTPGATTKERILSEIQRSPSGLTVKELSMTLNRPVSLVQHYLKLLKSEGKINGRLMPNSDGLAYSKTVYNCLAD